ncbi:MAG: SpoIIE family protein phosphatase [Desulfobulbaceae bacterium]|nr:SpoIIE family protein phosphatase [Desulfobulbaceae bacterium]
MRFPPVDPLSVFAEVEIDNLASATVAKQLAGKLASCLGFSVDRQADAVLVASELAHNHVSHQTRNGVIRLAGNIVGSMSRLCISSLDQGPGLEHLTPKLKSVIPNTIGLGAGLGTVARLSDQLFICSGPSSPYPCKTIQDLSEYVSVITANLWPHPQSGTVCHDDFDFDIQALIRPRDHEPVSGDGMSLQQDKRYVRISVADGAGSGHVAAAIIKTAFKKLDELALLWPPDQIIEALEPIMATTRGLSIHIALFDRYERKLQCATVGNIRVFMIIDGMPVHFPVQQGSVGYPRWQQITRFEKEPVSRILAFAYTDGQEFLTELEKYSEKYAGKTGEDAGEIPASLWGQALFNPHSPKRHDTTLVVWQWPMTSKNVYTF